MKIWRLCREIYAADSFSGEGSRIYGGRWNSPGVPMIYASSSLALAAIELFVHVEPRLMPRDLVSISAELPSEEPCRRWEGDALPPEWWTDAMKPMQRMGDAWIRGKSSLAVMVPSVPIRQEWNVLVNPLHPLITEVKIERPTPFHFDERMFAAR